MVRVITSTSASARLDAARAFLSGRPPATEVVIVGASRGAADDLARAVAVQSGATFGLSRFSFTELAARAAAERLAGLRHAPGTQAGTEALAARATFDARSAAELEYFDPVSSLPGFPRALARTMHELRLAGVSADSLKAGGPGCADLGRLLVRFEEALSAAGVSDRAALFAQAAAACRDGQVRWARLPLLLLDVPLDSRAEQEFVGALASASPEMMATVPHDDVSALAALGALGASPETVADPAPEQSDLARLRRYIFSSERPATRARSPERSPHSVSLFSAPGEGREAVEIVRRVLDEAQAGVPFDEMAVLLRAPGPYLGLLEHACARAGVPPYFERGTERPDPAGRAFIALLSCAVEGLSAKRFDEYLSLGQVPQVGDVAPAPLVVSTDEASSFVGGPFGSEEIKFDQPATILADSDDEAVVAGTLRSPWKWEELIVESAVVGGRTRADGKARWRRRLDGLKADYEYRIHELETEEPDSARISRYRRDLRNLLHLRQFALPIIDRLADWPDEALWGEWIERFADLARRALRRPVRVLETLADLRPMAAIGPVGVEEARDVLHDRLSTLDRDPPSRRYGRLFIGTPHQARGRSFRVVFVPGLAERVVPQRPREDPLLLDTTRRVVARALVTVTERGAAERLLLKISIGAARDRLFLSYPRLDVSETRARVPSFYALDVMRAMTGTVPNHQELEYDAALEGGANLAWPAPPDPRQAIDDLEHDLASLRPLLDAPDRAAVKGRANYMLGLNAALHRSVISRWSRERPAWSSSDGLIRVAPGTRAALEANRLNKRAYSLSALQRFSTCPYQFLLATIYRLEPWDEPEPLVRMDPLTRGSLFHKVQADFYRALEARGALPIGRAQVHTATATLDEVLTRVAAEYEETLAPAIERVWKDEIEEIRRDLGIWLQRIAGADSPDAWQPAYFEFSFGLNDEGRDPRSLKDPVTIDGRFILRGSVDLIERRPDLDVLRVTDHKTGKNRSNKDLIVGGGATLQPVLYSVAIEQGLGRPVVEGRLFYATTAGAYAEHSIKIDDYARRQGLEVLEIVDRAVESGFLAPAPAERACTWCDFRPVCGPREAQRTGRKHADRLKDLVALRSMR